MFKNKAYSLLVLLSLAFIAIVGLVSYILVPKFPTINFLSTVDKVDSRDSKNIVSEFKINEKDDAFKVIAVTDGDTIKIDYYGKPESFIFNGTDTPETRGETSTCYAKEAKDFLVNALSGKDVRLETDSSGSERDRYNRLLRYVYLNGENINNLLILNGFASEVSYTTEYKFQKEFKRSQLEAHNKKLGIWSEECRINP